MAKTHEEFVKEIESYAGDVYEYLTEYTKSKSPIKLKTKCCGFIWSPRASDILSPVKKGKVPCPNCSSKRAGKHLAMSHNEFVERVFMLVGDEYEILTQYKRAHEKVLFIHKTCGNKFYKRPSDFLHNEQYCPTCSLEQSRKNRATTNSDFIKRVKDIHGDIYDFLSEYKGSKKHIEVRHKECGYKWSCAVRLLIHERYRESLLCPKCNNVERLNKESFEKRLYKITGDKYSVLGEYINVTTPIKIQHSNCLFIFTESPSVLLYEGQECPNCHKHLSKGEREIFKFLVKNNIVFETEFTFSDCFLERVLRFDFAVFDNNNNLKLLIEYDGEHHFYPIDFNGKGRSEAENEFKLIQKRDKIKDEYCNNKNISLLRIPYWQQESIEVILHEKLLNNL